MHLHLHCVGLFFLPYFDFFFILCVFFFFLQHVESTSSRTGVPGISASSSTTPPSPGTEVSIGEYLALSTSVTSSLSAAAPFCPVSSSASLVDIDFSPVVAENTTVSTNPTYPWLINDFSPSPDLNSEILRANKIQPLTSAKLLATPLGNKAVAEAALRNPAFAEILAEPESKTGEDTSLPSPPTLSKQAFLAATASVDSDLDSNVTTTVDSLTGTLRDALKRGNIHPGARELNSFLVVQWSLVSSTVHTAQDIPDVIFAPLVRVVATGRVVNTLPLFAPPKLKLAESVE